MDYKYEAPEGEKYRVSIRKWNKVFPKRGTWPFTSVTVYVNGGVARIEFTASIVTKILLIVLAPIFFAYAIFICGAKQAYKEYFDILLDKSRGKFISDAAYRKHTESWRKIMKLIDRPW